MLGLPKQTLEDIKDTLYKILELTPEHISTYSLIIEPNTKIEKQVNKKVLTLPTQELEREMYWYIKNVLEQNGYRHYEISNFAKKDKESKHNVDCWKQKEYIGFGAGAHSYFNNNRFCNISDLNKYLQKDFTPIINEIQTLEEKQKEYILLGLRMLDGISKRDFKDIEIYRKEFDKLKQIGLLTEDDKTIKLTDKGLDLANVVFQEFV